MEELHNVYVQKGYDTNIYEMYSFKALSTAVALRNCASRFGLVAFITTTVTESTSHLHLHTCGKR